jgi:GT2 family glycosyltransferase
VEISASIVTYKTARTELDSVLSSFRLSTVNCRVIIVDNSPTDELRSIAEAYTATYIHTPTNLGFGAAHNLAIQKSIAYSKYHLVVNPDIRFGRQVIEELVQFMDSHPDIGQVMPKILYEDGREQHLCKLLPTPLDLLLRRAFGEQGKGLFRKHWDRYELRDIDLNIPREIPCLSGCFMFLRSSIVRGVGGFDERYFMYLEDVDLCRRIGEHAKTVFYPFVSVVHGYAKGSYKNGRLLGHHLRSAFQYFQKWGWLYDTKRKGLNTRTGLVSSNEREHHILLHHH